MANEPYVTNAIGRGPGLGGVRVGAEMTGPLIPWVEMTRAKLRELYEWKRTKEALLVVHLCTKCDEPVPVERVDECEEGDVICAACPCDPDNEPRWHRSEKCWCGI